MSTRTCALASPRLGLTHLQRCVLIVAVDSATPDRGRSFTRRSFVKRSGLVGGALWLAATGWEKTIGRAVAALTAGPTAKARKTYVALTEAYSAHDPSMVPRAPAAEIGKRFDAWYAGQGSMMQRIADSLLEDVANGFDGPFHRAGLEKRLAFLRLWATGHEDGPRHRAPRPGAERDWASPKHFRLIAEHAAKPEHASDPTDDWTAKRVPRAGAAPTFARPKFSREQLRRASVMTDALTLVCAPLHPSDAHAVKPPPVRV